MPLPWKDQFASQIRSATSALATLRQGSNIFVSSSAVEPGLLLRTLGELAKEWDQDAIHLYALSPGSSPDVQALPFRRFAFSLPVGESQAISPEALCSIPVPPWRIARLFGHEIPLDMALVQVSPPDEHGFCSLGPSVDIAKGAIEAAHTVIAEVNPFLPWTWGNSMIHVDRVQALVENEQQLPEIAALAADDTDREIARHVATLVADEATLGLGWGAIAEATLANLAGRRNLGLHTDIFSDAMMALIQSGAILNRAKSLHPDRVVASRCLGSARLYEYIHDNPLLEFLPWDHVCAPEVVAQNARMTAINVALAADLTGRACLARMSGGVWRESGANVGLAMGAAQAHDGRSIVALRSLDAEGHSAIGLDLPSGSMRTLDGADAHFLVTEYGIAELWGRTVEERVAEIINVAHPDMRPDLYCQAQEHGYLTGDCVSPIGHYPAEVETTAKLPSGLTMHVRPVKPSDERLIRGMFYSLSDEALYSRFFRVPKSVPPELIQVGERIDYDREMTLVGLIQDAGRERAIAIGRYVVDAESGMADVALLVQDDLQRQGIGTWLLLYLGQIARMRGVRGFRADILVSNYRALGLVNKQNADVKAALKNGYYSVSYEFPEGTAITPFSVRG